MTFKSRLEALIDKEFDMTFPLTVIDKSTILYKTFRISQSKTGHWDLKHLNDDIIHTFKLKSTAIAAAEYYGSYNFKKIEELKCLDTEYWSNAVDVSFYKHRLTQDIEQFKKDVIRSRLNTAYDNTKRLKKEIIKRINIDFS